MDRLIEQKVVNVLMSVVQGFDVSAAVLLFLGPSDDNSLSLRWSCVESFTEAFGLIRCDDLTGR